MELNLGTMYSKPGIPSFAPDGLDLADAGIDLTANEKTTSSTIELGHLANIDFSGVKRLGCQVIATDNGYKIPIKSQSMGNKVIEIIASSNPDINVTYSEDLEKRAQKLTKKTKKPLWAVTAENGAILLERNF